MRQEKLEQVIEMISLINNMSDEDMAISVWDREGIMLYFKKPETFSLHFERGFKLEDKNDKIFMAMETGKTKHNKLPKEVFGVAVEGNLVPIFDGKVVVGCIACVVSLEKIEQLENRTNVMESVLDESKEVINEILKAAISTTDYLKNIHEFMDNLESSVKGVYTVVDSIKMNTSRTRMLALKASIEAARAGESGKGFKIVASEMGALSQMSTESMNKINDTLNEMVKSIDDITNTIKQIDNVSF